MQTGFSRIAIKFFLILVPVAIVTTSAATAFLGYLRYQETGEALVAEVTAAARASARTLAEPMWSMNRIVVEDVVASLLVDPKISCVDLLDDVSGTVQPADDASCAASTTLGPRVAVDILYAGDPIGRLVLGIDEERVFEELTAAVTGALWLFLALMAANLIAAVVALRTTVLVPLERLLAAIRTAGRQTFRKPVEWAARDELGAVIAAYNEMIGEIEAHESAMRASEERFRGTFEGTAVGMAIVENDGRYSLVNDAFREILGYSESELLTMSYLDVTHPEERNESESRAEEFNAGNLNHRTVEKRYVRKNGETLWVIVSASNIRDSEGSILHTIRQVQDISERKRAEVDLRHARHAAEMANAAKSVFLANMSHEFRTPLNSINGFAEMMSHEMLGPLPEHYKEYAKLINTSGMHLLKIISDVLDMSKIEAGKMELNEEPTNVTAIVDEAIALIDEQARQNNVAMVRRFESVEGLLADPLRLKQAVLNLLSNAVKFSPAGTGTVTVSIDPCLDSGGLRIVVSDNGIGMTDEDVALAMQPFGQAEGQAFTRRFEGTGLGLPLTAQLVELHDGTLHIESRPHVGTTVTVTFPPERRRPIE
jgi:PAS domain S-box-containing protein